MMKKSMKMISLALVLALIITSVPNEWTARVVKVEAAETGESQTQQQMLTWNGEEESVDADKLNEAKNVYATTVEYGEEQEEFEYKDSLDAGVSPDNSYSGIVIDESAAAEALSLDEGKTLSVSGIGYQWYVVDAKGEKTVLEGADQRQLDLGGDADDDMKVNNGTGDKTFVCAITVTELEDSDGNSYSTEDLGEEYNWTVERNFTLTYAGDTVTKSELDEHFSGVDDLMDERFQTHYSDEVESFFHWMYADEVKNKDDTTGRYNYTWVTHFTDGTKKEEEKIENKVSLMYHGKRGRLYDTFYNETTEEEEEKRVDYYECKLELCYGYQVIDTVSKKFYFLYTPIAFNESEDALNITQTIRNNAAVYLDAAASIRDKEAVKPDSLAYQWYRIDENGNEKRLDGETAPTYAVRVPNTRVSYKVVVTAEKKEGYDGPEFSDLVRTYKFKSSGGYLLKDRSRSSYAINIGDTQELYVKAQVDDGYKLKYNWQRISYKDVEQEDGEVETQVVKETVGTGNKYKVTPTQISDFETVNECSETNWNTCNYAVTVSVMKGEEELDTYSYYFSILEDISYQITEQSSSNQVLDLGDDLDLFVKTEVKDCYRLEQNWYKKLAEEKVKKIYDDVSGDWVYESVDPEFALAESSDIEKVSDRGYYDDEDNYVYTRTYYKKLGKGEKYSRKGKDSAGKPVDVRGSYMCRLEMFRVEDGNNNGDSDGGEGEKIEPLTGTRDVDFTVTYDSDLSAYAKNDRVTVKEGEKARFRIVAQTKNDDLYKIQYLWEKYDEEEDQYVEVKDETGKKVTKEVYEIPKAQIDHAGMYRVTVSDSTGEKLSPIYLTLSVQEADVPDEDTEKDVTGVEFTPKYSYYDLHQGETVNLNVDMKLSEKVDVFYAWYRNEKVNKQEGQNGYYEFDWELLGQDTNRYALKVQDEDDFTTYKCVVIYRKNTSEYEQKEFHFVVRQSFSACLERMTPQTQFKRVGDSAAYSVRFITEDPNLKAKYQWYRSGEPVKGANGATYQVNKLEKDDFGWIYCEVTDEKSGRSLAAPVSFQTKVYLNGAYLEKSQEDVETELNAAETVFGPPVVEKGEGLKLSYQWYRVNGQGNRTIIYGATKSTYVIDEFGANDFCTYECEVYANGFYLDTYKATAQVKKEEEQPGDEDVPPITVEIRDGYKQEVEAFLGKRAAFAVTAKSNKNLALKYQWYNGEDKAIGGATSSEYVIDVVTPSRKGEYYCIVTDEKGNKITSEIFSLTTTTGLTVDNEGLDWRDAIGVQTTFDEQNLTLTANASASEENGYTPFFQWYYKTTSDKGLIYGATSRQLVIPKVDEDALGMYYCVVSDNSGAEAKTLSYYVYVNTGLNVMPGAYYVVAKDDGTADMYVTAAADDGYDITYEWSKYDKDAEVTEYPDKFVPIEGAAGPKYTIRPLKQADYGKYRCIISTRGERNVYEFMIQPDVSIKSNRAFAFQGDEVTVKTDIENPAADLTYKFQWYEKEPTRDAGGFRKIKGATSASCTKVVPKLNLSEQFTGNDKLGYVPVSYKCVVTVTGTSEDGSTYEEEMTYDTSVRVLPEISFREDRFPETTHPNDKAFDIQGYRARGAEKLKLEFSDKTDLGSANLYIISRDGSYWTTADDVDKNGHKWEPSQSVTVPGDTVVLLMNSNRKADSYGYQVASVQKIAVPHPGTGETPGGQQPGSSGQQPGSQQPGGQQTNAETGKALKASGSGSVKKGSKHTIKGLRYKVTSTSAKNRTVTVTGAKSKKAASISIPASVKISGNKYKVTSVAAKAFQGFTKLKTVTIGANVKKIGAGAFAKDKKLTKLTFKGKTLKSVGKKAFSGVPKKAKAGVPKKSRKAYKKTLKKGGFKGKVK